MDAAGQAGKSMSDVSSTTSGPTAYTPSRTDATEFEEPSTGFHSHTVPWPGNTYIIVDRTSRRAITLTASGICLQQISEQTQDTRNRWLCVEDSGYFGFHNIKSGTYLGRKEFAVCATSTRFRTWESFMARAHPHGGYQLLMPHWWYSLKVVVVASDGCGLEVRDHGETRWEFVKV